MKKKAKQEWNEIHFPKLLGKKVKSTAKVAKVAKVKKQSGTASSAASMAKNFKPPPATKKRALTRADYLSKTTPQGKSEWEAIIGTIKGNRATTKVPVTKFVDIPKGIEVTEGGIEQEGKEFEGGQKKVTTMEESGISSWTDAYTGERILDSGKIHIDHRIPIDRAIRSGKFKKLGDAQKFGGFLKNLVVTKGETNIAKGAKDLSQFTPSHEPEKYAKGYGSVMSKLGLVMTHGEARAYKRMTGNVYETEKFEHSRPGETNPVQHILDMQRAEPIAETQTRHDMWMMRARKK